MLETICWILCIVSLCLISFSLFVISITTLNNFISSRKADKVFKDFCKKQIEYIEKEMKKEEKNEI